MEQFTMTLLEDIQRPTLVISAVDGVRAMLDTGASFPVWVAPEHLLVSLYKAELVQRNVAYGGFGGRTQGNMYRLPIVQVGKLIFPNMRILTGNTDIPCQMILSATMFKNLIYEIDDKNHKLNVTIPDDESLVRDIKLRDSKGNEVILCSSETQTTQKRSIYDIHEENMTAIGKEALEKTNLF